MDLKFVDMDTEADFFKFQRPPFPYNIKCEKEYLHQLPSMVLFDVKTQTKARVSIVKAQLRHIDIRSTIVYSLVLLIGESNVHVVEAINGVKHTKIILVGDLNVSVSGDKLNISAKNTNVCCATLNFDNNNVYIIVYQIGMTHIDSLVEKLGSYSMHVAEDSHYNFYGNWNKIVGKLFKGRY